MICVPKKACGRCWHEDDQPIQQQRRIKGGHRCGMAKTASRTKFICCMIVFPVESSYHMMPKAKWTKYVLIKVSKKCDFYNQKQRMHLTVFRTFSRQNIKENLKKSIFENYLRKKNSVIYSY